MKYAQTHEQRHEFWQDQIAKWKISGKTKEVFCEEQGLGYYSFLRWSSRLNEESAKGSTFVEVGGTQQSGIEATAKVEIDQPVAYRGRRGNDSSKPVDRRRGVVTNHPRRGAPPMLTNGAIGARVFVRPGPTDMRLEEVRLLRKPHYKLSTDWRSWWSKSSS